MLLCRRLLRQNWRRSLSVAASALRNSDASFSTTALSLTPPKKRFRDYSTLCTSPGIGAVSGYGAYDLPDSDKKKLESGGQLDTDEKDLEESDELSDEEEINDTPAKDICFDENDLASDASVWALYKRWCPHYGVERTPEEMQERFNTFKENAKRVIRFKKLDLGAEIYLKRWADGDDFPIGLYYYKLKFQEDGPLILGDGDSDGDGDGEFKNGA